MRKLTLILLFLLMFAPALPAQGILDYFFYPQQHDSWTGYTFWLEEESEAYCVDGSTISTEVDVFAACEYPATAAVNGDVSIGDDFNPGYVTSSYTWEQELWLGNNTSGETKEDCAGGGYDAPFSMRSC